MSVDTLNHTPVMHNDKTIGRNKIFLLCGEIMIVWHRINVYQVCDVILNTGITNSNISNWQLLFKYAGIYYEEENNITKIHLKEHDSAILCLYSIGNLIK